MVSCLWQFFRISFLYFFIPQFIIGWLTGLIFADSDLGMLFFLSAWYLIGIRAAYEHHVWRQKNIAHLLRKKPKEQGGEKQDNEDA